MVCSPTSHSPLAYSYSWHHLLPMLYWPPHMGVAHSYVIYSWRMTYARFVLCVCVCVRVCVRACVRACMHTCVCPLCRPDCMLNILLTYHAHWHSNTADNMKEQEKELMKNDRSHVLTHGFAPLSTCRDVRWCLPTVYVDRFHVLAVLSPAWHCPTPVHMRHLWGGGQEEEEVHVVWTNQCRFNLQYLNQSR